MQNREEHPGGRSPALASCTWCSRRSDIIEELSKLAHLYGEQKDTSSAESLEHGGFSFGELQRVQEEAEAKGTAIEEVLPQIA